MTDIVEYPEWVMLRDTMLHDDMGGLGQRIYTSAGSGYTKQKYIRADVVESLRQQLKIQEDAANHWFTEANNDHNRCVKLEQQLAECKGLAQKWNDYYRGLHHPRCDLLEAAGFETLGNKCTCLECIREDVSKELAECQAKNTKLSERVVGVGEIAINSVSRDRLAECQAREKVLRDALVDLRSCMEGVIEGDYEPDSFTLQPSNIALALPSDSTALDTLLKQAKREEVLKIADTFEILGGASTSKLRNWAKELE